MSTSAAPALVPELEGYARAWARSLAAALQSIREVNWEVRAQAPSTAPVAGEDDLWIHATSVGDLAGTVALRIDRASACRLVQPAGSDKLETGKELSEQNRSVLLEWISRAAEAVPASIQRTAHQFRVEFAVPSTESPAASFWIQIQNGDPTPIVAEVRLDHTSLLSRQSLSRVPLPATSSAEEMKASKLGMLMDVELVVAVRFGGRRMLLKDILDLCAGSVVELDQRVQEPVDLLLDGKLIARGEVVVVEGNYGLRVTEVLPSAEN